MISDEGKLLSEFEIPGWVKLDPDGQRVKLDPDGQQAYSIDDDSVLSAYDTETLFAKSDWKKKTPLWTVKRIGQLVAVLDDSVYAISSGNELIGIKKATGTELYRCSIGNHPSHWSFRNNESDSNMYFVNQETTHIVEHGIQVIKPTDAPQIGCLDLKSGRWSWRRRIAFPDGVFHSVVNIGCGQICYLDSHKISSYLFNPSTGEQIDGVPELDAATFDNIIIRGSLICVLTADKRPKLAAFDVNTLKLLWSCDIADASYLNWTSQRWLILRGRKGIPENRGGWNITIVDIQKKAVVYYVKESEVIDLLKDKWIIRQNIGGEIQAVDSETQEVIWKLAPSNWIGHITDDHAFILNKAITKIALKDGKEIWSCPLLKGFVKGDVHRNVVIGRYKGNLLLLKNWIVYSY